MLDSDFCNTVKHYVHNEQVPLIDSSKEIKHFRDTSAVLAGELVPHTVVVIIRQYKQWRKSAIEANKRHKRSLCDLLGRDAENLLATVRLLLRNAPFVPYIEWLTTNLRLIWAARHSDSVIIASADDVKFFIHRFTDVRRENVGHEVHIVRGNRVAKSGARVLKDFRLSRVNEIVFKSFSRLISSGP
jgi:hypothetical protein